MAQMAAQSRFAEAAYAHLRGLLDRLASNPMVLRLANDGVRLSMAYLSLYMDAQGELSRQAVRQLFAGIGLSSPGRATALLMQLRLIKFIEPDPIQLDRRTKRYRPTAAMKKAFVDLMNMGLEATALLEPEAAGFIPQFEQPVFFKGFVLAIGDSFLKMFKNLEGQPRNMFADTTAGHLMLYRLMLDGREQTYPPRGELAFVSAALAREFKVARSHARRTFDRAADQDLIRYGTGYRSIMLAEPFRQHLGRLHAAMFINNLRCVHAAKAFALTQGL